LMRPKMRDWSRFFGRKDKDTTKTLEATAATRTYARFNNLITTLFSPVFVVS
jgi:hypothetical protein